MQCSHIIPCAWEKCDLIASLGDFCRFFLAPCIDQARYMGDLLCTDNMERRIAA